MNIFFFLDTPTNNMSIELILLNAEYKRDTCGRCHEIHRSSENFSSILDL